MKLVVLRKIKSNSTMVNLREQQMLLEYLGQVYILPKIFSPSHSPPLPRSLSPPLPSSSTSHLSYTTIDRATTFISRPLYHPRYIRAFIYFCICSNLLLPQIDTSSRSVSLRFFSWSLLISLQVSSYVIFICWSKCED